MSHTPGPWKIDPQPGNRWNVMHASGVFYWTLHESEDNTRIVAAAPDLLCPDAVVMGIEARGQEV